ncbi:MAG: hypothetical protein JJU07_14215 [Natronohydrobacter sp.]|nr:hypothetical protein [Natronohydrobacter sp.]
MQSPRFTRTKRAVANLQRHPHQPLGFVFGAALPLIIVALSWAHTTGGLAGPTPDPRPAAFVVETD